MGVRSILVLRGGNIAADAKVRGRPCGQTTTPEYDRRREMAAVAQQSGITSRRCRSSRRSCCRARPSSRAGWPSICTPRSPSSARSRTTSCARSCSAAPRRTSARCCGCWRDGASIDDVVVPHEALEFLRGNVRRGIPLPALLRSYRLGHAWLWERWSQALQERVEDSGELAAGQDQSSAFMFAYVDKVSDALVEEFGTERERMMRSASQLRAETVRAILAGEPIDEEVASRRLGYELRRHHVALRVASAGSEVRGLERAVDEAAAAARAGEAARRALGRGALRRVVRARYGAPATDELERYEPPAGSARRVRQAGRGDRGVPQLARRGAAGRAHRVARRRRRGDELRGRRARLAAGRRPAAGARVRRASSSGRWPRRPSRRSACATRCWRS